ARPQVASEIGVINMLIHVADDHPVGLPAARLPAVVVMFEGGADKRVAAHFKMAEPNLRVRLEHFDRAVARTVIKDEVALDRLVIMPEEVRQHAFFIPAEGVEVDTRVSARPDYT